jgi:hypothetical protein
MPPKINPFSTPSPKKKGRKFLFQFAPGESNTAKEYRKRCPAFPRPGSVYHLPSRANFEPMSGNQIAVSRWLMSHARTVSDGEDIVIAPDLEIEIDPSHGIAQQITSDMPSLQHFYKRVILESKLGLLSFVYRRLSFSSMSKEWVHAIPCIVDARDSSEQDGMQGSVQCYFVDPTGSEVIDTDPDFASSHRILRKVIRKHITEFVLSPLQLHSNVRTFLLKSPVLNDHKTETMSRMDAMNGLHIQDNDDGFCQPWAYIIMLDVICAPRSFLRKNHFKRLWEEAGGKGLDEENRRYSRLLYVRMVLSWIASQMQPFKNIGWKGPVPFSEKYQVVTLSHA